MVNNPELSLNEFIPYILSVLSNEISQNIASQYEQGFGIDLHQWRVMAILGEHSALSAVEVSHKTAMDKVAVSRAVKKIIGIEVFSLRISLAKVNPSFIGIITSSTNISGFLWR